MNTLYAARIAGVCLVAQDRVRTGCGQSVDSVDTSGRVRTDSAPALNFCPCQRTQQQPQATNADITLNHALTASLLFPAPTPHHDLPPLGRRRRPPSRLRACQAAADRLPACRLRHRPLSVPHSLSPARPANTAGNHVALTPCELGAGRAGKTQQPAARRCRFDSGNRPILQRRKNVYSALFAPKQPGAMQILQNTSHSQPSMRPAMRRSAMAPGIAPHRWTRLNSMHYALPPGCPCLPVCWPRLCAGKTLE